MFSGEIPIEIENLTNLEKAELNENQFTGELDLSNSTNLDVLDINSNNFSLLDIRNTNNSNFIFFDAMGNSELSCIFVDNINWSEANWANVEPTSTFVETQAQCNALSIYSVDSVSKCMVLYPNPTRELINIKHPNTIKKIKIYNTLGKLINIKTREDRIDLSDLSQGVYLIRLINNSGKSQNFKIIKE